MARTPDVLDDPTPLDAPGVDVRVRVAWLLRMSRSVGVDGVSISVTDMAALLRDQGLSATPPSVSGWETGRVAPSAAVVEAYERALGRSPGTLRGAMDVLRRSFGVAARPMNAMSPSMADVDRACAPVVAGGEVTGAEWLHFCDTALGVQPGLPSSLVRPAVDRMVSELARSVFTAYLTRYESLALLRCGQYADLVLDALSDYVDQPGTQILADPLSVAAERADGPGLDLLLTNLGSEETLRVRGAAFGIENLHQNGLPSGLWRRVVDPYVAAHRAARGDRERSAQLEALWPLLPREVREAAEPRLLRPPPAAPSRTVADRDRRAQLALSARIADRVCAEVGIVPQPLLARLVHEAAFDHRRTRVFTSSVLLMASPVRGVLGEVVGEVGHDETDPVLRERLAELLVSLGDHRCVPHVTRWVDSGDPDLVAPGLVALAHVRGPLDDTVLNRLLEQPGVVGRRALYYAGMVGHDAVGRIAADATHPQHAAARWWQQQGPVVTD